MSAQEAVVAANGWAVRGDGVTTYVTTEALSVRWPDGRDTRVRVSRDRGYMAVAPYVKTTHPCNVRYISSYRAELAGTPFRVTATADDGRVVFRGELVSLPNGCVEPWLTRDLDLTLSVEAPGLGLPCEGRVLTRPASHTCITDIELDRPLDA